MFKKHHSSCIYTYTVAKAVYDVGKGLGATIKVNRTKRCSGPEETVVDALSKVDWNRAWPLMTEKDEKPGRVPRAILQWIHDPKADMSFGMKILQDRSEYTNVLL